METHYNEVLGVHKSDPQYIWVDRYKAFHPRSYGHVHFDLVCADWLIFVVARVLTRKLWTDGWTPMEVITIAQ